MRHLSRSLFFVPVMIIVCCVAALAQGRVNQSVGRTPTPQEIQARDISVGPEGKELPPGHGTAKEGASVYAAKCALCHGPTGEESKLFFGRLVGGRGTLNTWYVLKTPTSYYPFATTIWSFIRMAMPQTPLTPNALPEGYLFPQGKVPTREEWLKAGNPEYANIGAVYFKEEDMPTTGVNPNLTFDQIYAVTAYILWRDNIIKEDEVMDQNTLPKVRMPNRDGFSVMADGKVPVWESRDPKTRIEPHVSPNSKPLPPGSKPVNEVY